MSKTFGSDTEKDADELQLYARSEGRRQKEASILARQRSKLEAESQYLHDGLSLPQRMKRHDRAAERTLLWRRQPV